jgi:hypothetical protein
MRNNSLRGRSETIMVDSEGSDALFRNKRKGLATII